MRRLTTEEFIQKAQNIHDHKYDYSKCCYINARTKVCIICPVHGEFWQTPDAHLRPQGCPECKKITLHKTRVKPTEVFIQQANEIHNNKYDYSKSNYINEKEKVCIICPEHGEFQQTPDNHINGKKGCPHCKESHGEQLIRNFLQNNKFIFKSQVRNKINQQLIILDFVVKINNEYQIIEYNGIQHYVPREHFGGELQFEKQQKRDQLLRDRCNEKSIKLHEIPYTWSDSEVIQYLTDNLK